MRYIIIEPAKRILRAIDADYTAALHSAGLESLTVDHGVVDHGISIVVYEYGLFADPATQHYFAIHKRLYAGNALLYAYDEEGVTIDLKRSPEVTFFPNVDAIEHAIAVGLVQRPRIAAFSWQWPDPKPEYFERKKGE